MGYIKTTPMTDAQGEASGEISLEIIYGGKEAPFGGMDTSGPPAYIDPNCLVTMDGVLVIENTLNTVAMLPIYLPTLWGGVSGVTFLGAGSFYSSIYGTLNYILGGKAVTFSGPPSGVTYTYYMTAWVPVLGGTPVVIYNDVLTLSLFNALVGAVSASLTLPLLSIGSASAAFKGTGASATITGVTNTVTPSGGGPTVTYPGIPTGVVISGGQGYTTGTYYIVPTGTTFVGYLASVNITAVSGVITAASLNMSSFSYGLYGGAVSIPGWGYSIGAVTLFQASTVDLILKIVNGASNNTYTIAVPAVTSIAPPTSGSGGIGTVANVAAGTLVTLNTSSFFGSKGGSNYAVGQYYYVVSGTNSSAVGVVTAVNTGGAISSDGSTYIGFNIINSGVAGGAPYVTGNAISLSPCPVPSVVSTAASALTAMASAINGTGTYPPDPNVTASLSTDGGSLILTAIIPGTVGNAITAQDLSVIVGGSVPYYYFPCRSPLNLYGGMNAYTAYNSTPLPLASCVAVGGMLYIGNVGAAILKYIPGAFEISTLYQGVKILKRFAGSLIGLGMISAAGTVNTNQDMMFLWSAAQNLDIWSPLTATGNVTGAGFAQLADINDFLTGLIVSNNTAFILRSQGLSYATALASGSNPYQFSHIALGDKGEGAQLPQLVTQYNESGVFVGSTDIYKVSGGLQSIGTKIRSAFFTTLTGLVGELLTCNACSVLIGGLAFPLVVFAIDGILYTYLAENNTWGQITLADSGMSAQQLCTFALGPSISGDGNFCQTQMVLIQQAMTGGGITGQALVDAVAQPGGTTTNTLIFPVEEISFGRDITIQAIYIAYYAVVSNPIILTFYISGVLFNTTTITATTPGNTPQELKIFFGSPGIFTAHSPQLTVDIVTTNSEGADQFNFTKLMMLGSFDPNQNPV